MIDYQKDPDYEECIVSYIDILGFRQLMNTKSAADILKIIEIFRHESKPYKLQHRKLESLLAGMSNVKMETISDAVVRARTFHTEHKDGALCREIWDLRFIQAQCVEHGILLRGAHTIGHVHIGYDPDSPVFGPGLVDAFFMEDREAIYPRIIIDDMVIERHKKDRSLWNIYNSADEEKRDLLSLLNIDEAGLHFIDYLAPQEMVFLDSTGYYDYLLLLSKHKEHIENSLLSEDKRNIRRKYFWLRNYHNKAICSELKRQHKRLNDYDQELGDTHKDYLSGLIMN